MEIRMIGIDHHGTPLEIREKISFCQNNLPEAYKRLEANGCIKECVILSTCNRVEMYALLAENRPEMLRDFLRDFHDYGGPLDRYLFEEEGEAAVHHLCRVAAGMESMAFGEPQIFGQVKDAYRTAELCGGVGRVFSELFPQVFSIVKKIRAKTKIGEYHVSVGSVAVMQAKLTFGDLADTQVMVIGAGEIGELAARSLKANGSHAIFVVNRTFQKAVEVAENVGGTPIMLHELPEYLLETSIVISSVRPSEYILSASALHTIAAKRNYAKLLIVDIAVPRGIDPDAAGIEGVRLLNIDDLRGIAEKGASERAHEIEKAMAIITEKSVQVMERLNSIDLIPTFLFLRRKAEEIRREGINRVIPKLASSKLGLEELESLTKSIINRILSHSEEKMREYSKSVKH